jgi:uncharacterized OsmC-like protein
MQYLREHERELQPFTVTIQVAKKDDFLSSASRTGSDLVWTSDEPKDRGGQGLGPSPLSYFLSSMGFCQFVHFAEHAMERGLAIESLEMKVEGKASMQRPRRFTGVTYEVRIASPEGDEAIKDLAKAAAEDCYVTNTLREACTVKGLVFLNGKMLDEH